VAATRLDRSDIVDLEPVPAADEIRAANPAPASRPVIHDDYCAIHDEYGSCTCGAAFTAAEPESDAATP
jgi:hypothetical protein